MLKDWPLGDVLSERPTASFGEPKTSVASETKPEVVPWNTEWSNVSTSIGGRVVSRGATG